jgi:hypothetical protein
MTSSIPVDLERGSILFLYSDPDSERLQPQH